MQTGTLVRLRGNQDLGPARLLRTNAHGTAWMKPLYRGDELQVQGQLLERFPLYKGQRVSITSIEGRFVVRDIQELDGDDELRRCIITDGDTNHNLPESDLVPAYPSIDDPVSFFESLQWDQPHHFFARLNLSLTRTQWYSVSEGIPTFRGARIRPLAHQLYAARRVLEAHSPRFVLADEVGLGKTIEAGLVIQALLAVDPDLRVLVVAPGSMSRQWLCELYLRFGGRAFVHVPGEVLGGVSAAERRRRLGAPLLIVSTTALLVDESFRNALVDRPWDLVVVDEAHQISPQHFLYATMRELSARSTGFLALSATPSKREVRGLTGLLALVAPDAYTLDDGDALAAKLKDRRDIWGVLTSTEDILGAARESEDGAPDQETIEFLYDDWNRVLPDEPEVARMLGRARDGELAALDELVAYVQEHYRIDHRIVRTRRRTLDILGTQFACRQLQHLDYEPSAPEVLLDRHLDKLPTPEVPTAAQTLLRTLFWRGLCATAKTFIELIERRLAALEQNVDGDADACARALGSDPGPGEQEQLECLLIMRTPALPEERAWLEAARGLAREWLAAGPEACARHRDVVKWLGEFLTTSPNTKVLVFAQDRSTVIEFVEVLRVHHSNWGAEAFHHSMTEPELEEAAYRFQRVSKHRILVSDELGGEGRNFQMAACVVHLDTPLSVGRIEQRVGRLDRMGRDPKYPVLSIVVRGPSRVERALQHMHESAFRVFTDSVGGLEFVLPRLQTMMYAALGKGEDLDEITRQMESEVRSTLAEVDEDFELSLDSSKKQLEQARELAEIFEESADDGEERKVRHWLGTLGVESGRDRHKIKFKWTADTEPLLGFEGGTGSTPLGTFDRSAALANESLQYFAPGHKLVDAALAALSSSRRGRATMLIRDLGSRNRNEMFIVLLGTSRLDESGWGSEGIPAGLRTKAHRFLWPSAEIACVRIRLEDEEPQMVRDHGLRQQLIRIYEKDTGDRELTADELLEAGSSPGPLWSAVRAGVSTGLDELNRNLESLRDEAASELAEMMSMEMGYLRNQSRLGPIDARAAAQLGLQQRERLLESVRRTQVEPESIALVLGR